jgi:hypothetical protein
MTASIKVGAVFRSGASMFAFILVASAATFGFMPPAPQQLTILGLDYAFSVPARVRPGETVVRFENRGKKDHELNIALLKVGASPNEFMDSVRAGKPTAMFRDGPVGVLFAAPGDTSNARLVVDFMAGRTYVAICIFRDSANAPRHHQLGMSSVIVPAGGAVSATSVPVDTIIGNDYAFTRYPKTLAPGRHRFAFVNSGKIRHEVAFGLLKPGVSMKQLTDALLGGTDPGGLVETSFGLLHTLGTSRPRGMLELDLLPGREYVLICQFSDGPAQKPHFMLGMIGSITVRQR